MVSSTSHLLFLLCDGLDFFSTLFTLNYFAAYCFCICNRDILFLVNLNRCGVTDAKCAGVEVAHAGFCNLLELYTNVGSTMALRAAQSLQLVHILWLLVAGLLIVFGSV